MVHAFRRKRLRGRSLKVLGVVHAGRHGSSDAVAVLASVEQPAEIDVARKRGYASILVVADFQNTKAFKVPPSKATVVPCPAETHGTPCIRCRLCLDSDLLAIKAAIGLRVHGQHGTAARKAPC